MGWSRIRGYPGFCALVMAWAVLVTSRHGWAGDIGLHLSTVHELMRRPWHPLDPLVGADEGSPYHSPYMFLLATLARVTGAGPRTVLELGGLAGLGVWLWALGRFCRHFSPRPAVPVLTVIFTFVLWGTAADVIWSGFFGLRSLSWNLPYPSTLAAGLSLLTWDAFLSHRDRPDGRWAPLVAALTLGVTVLVHPFTAVNTLVGLGAFVLAAPGAAWKARPLRLLLAGGCGLVLVLLWPLADVTSLFSVAEDFGSVHDRLLADFLGVHGIKYYGLALIGLPALLTCGRRELQLLFLLASAMVVVGAVAGPSSLGRAIPIALLPLHLALARQLAEWGAWNRARVCGAVAVGAACLLGLLHVQPGGFLRAYWRVDDATFSAWGVPPDPRDPYAPLAAGIPAGRVVMTDSTFAGRYVNARGAFSVVPAWPYPYVDQERRERDSARFFAPETPPSERAVIADAYRVECVTVQEKRAVLGAGALPGFRLRARAPGDGPVLLCRK